LMRSVAQAAESGSTNAAWLNPDSSRPMACTPALAQISSEVNRFIFPSCLTARRGSRIPGVSGSFAVEWTSEYGIGLECSPHRITKWTFSESRTIFAFRKCAQKAQITILPRSPDHRQYAGPGQDLHRFAPESPNRSGHHFAVSPAEPEDTSGQGRGSQACRREVGNLSGGGPEFPRRQP
jgi:hypothetical protein